MSIKGLMAVAAVAGCLGLVSGDAAAKTNVHVGIGGYWGGGWVEPYPPYYSYYNPGYYTYGYNYAYPYNIWGNGYYKRRPYGSYGISCNSARRMLQRNGYYNVATRDCSGSVYNFIARRSGHTYKVAVSARTGAVVGRRRI
jgi:hypothetical protein